MEGRAALIIVGAAQVIAAAGADEFAAELIESLGAVGAVDTVVLRLSVCLVLNSIAVLIGFPDFHRKSVSRFFAQRKSPFGGLLMRST